MGLKKYEIITVGSDKRVRALRSWRVQDRYVNIGDVGGIVYDEKTLSQDGACWLFRGNFGFPGARIGGDSIVDVGEATLSTTGTPAVDILGSSVVVGSKLRFESEQTGADTVVLTANDFEQGTIMYVQGGNYESMKTPHSNFIRSKRPIFLGGGGKTLKCDVPGYEVQAVILDRDGNGVTASNSKQTGEGATLVVPTGQYMVIRLAKTPREAIVPADATAAQITFTGTYETKLSIIDSRVEINSATSTGISSIRPGGVYEIRPGVKYPDSVIRNSKVVINGRTTANRTIRLMSEFIGCNVAIDAAQDNAQGVGIYSNVNNLTFTGAVSADSLNVNAPSSIQATDCNNFAVSPTTFPGLAAARTANMPFVFQGCNVPNGVFYHHAQIKNTYVNIDFALAQADLGKAITSGQILASAEVEGMYRLYSTTGSVFGALAEAHDSVKSLNMTGGAATYGTTIYKDAYVSGIFDFAGTNVFGHKVRSHPLAQVLNVQPRAVQGMLNTIVVGETITGVTANANRVCVPVPFRVNGSKGLTINCPARVEGAIICTDINGVIKGLTGLATGESSVPAAQLVNTNAYLFFGKTGGTAITPADLAGVTVTVYNGCKIVNTGETAVNMKGNIRVEDNATLTDTSVTGTGYFGGNCVVSGPIIRGSVFMNDNAKLTKTAGINVIQNLRITENGSVNLGDVTTIGLLRVANNAVLTPTAITVPSCNIILRDNAVAVSALTVSGSLEMRDNARVSKGTLVVNGDITLCGSYNQTTSRTWTGKRTITDVNAPEYDNNVKTQYDF
jgi:predicted membrane protein